MRQQSDNLKLGKSAAFDKARLKRLRQENETWKADFRALPKPMMQLRTVSEDRLRQMQEVRRAKMVRPTAEPLLLYWKRTTACSASSASSLRT